MNAQANQQAKEEEELKQLKNDFLSSISHELRAPLANIKMATQMLKSLCQQDEERSTTISNRLGSESQFEPTNHVLPNHIYNALQESSLKTRVVHYIQILERECDREISLVNNVLDLQQLNAGTYGFSSASIHLESWLSEVIQPFLARIAKQQQQLEINGIKALPDITVDPLSLERMLNKLLNNACKFTPPGGKITITAYVLQADVAGTQLLQLKVTNSKVEIPASKLPYIFERFYRIPNYDRWKHGGTGLGLALVKALADHLGGSIKAESRNKQTCFTATIPIHKVGVVWLLQEG